jgi:hypothetical protein
MSDQKLSTNQNLELPDSVRQKPAATLSLSTLNLDLNLTNKKRKKSFVSSFRSRNSFDLISKSSCEFIDNDSNNVKVLPSSDSINNFTIDNFSLLNDFKNLNRTNFRFHDDNLAASKSPSSSSTGKFLRNFSNRLKMGTQNKTGSLCELSKLAAADSRQALTFFTKNIYDQLVPFNHDKTSSKTETACQTKNSEFENFSDLNFYNQCNVIFYLRFMFIKH